MKNHDSQTSDSFHLSAPSGEAKSLQPPTRGATVYGDAGQEAQYIAAIDGQHLVRPLYDAGGSDESPYYADPVLWGRVFVTAPKPVFEQSIQAQQQALDDLIEKTKAARTEHNELKGAIATMNREHADVMKRLRQHEALRNIDAYLDGKITHFVTVSEYDAPRVLTMQAALEGDSSVDRRKLRLLGLFGDPERDVHWSVMMYSDGSGSTKYRVHPCLSLEEAEAKQRELIVASFPQILHEGKYSAIQRYVELARSLAIPVPQNIAAKADEITRDAAEKTLASRRTEFDRAQQSLREAETAVKKATGEQA